MNWFTKNTDGGRGNRAARAVRADARASDDDRRERRRQRRGEPQPPVPQARPRWRSAAAAPASSPIAAAQARAPAISTSTLAVAGIAGVAGAAAYFAVRHWRAGREGQTLPVVADVDLARYSGTWYEQARLPNRFQRQCGGQVSAQYHLRPDGSLDVLNRCVGKDGHVDAVQGVARPVAVAGVRQPGRLAVRFASAWLSWLPPVWGEYWIIQLDEHYQHALVGTPDRRYLWILSRRPRLQASKVKELLEYAGALGFAVRRVIKTAV